MTATAPSTATPTRKSECYYDAPFGRFITRDTVLSEKPYLYCDGDPVNCSDPSGHETITIHVASGWDIGWAGGRFVGDSSSWVGDEKSKKAGEAITGYSDDVAAWGILVGLAASRASGAGPEMAPYVETLNAIAQLAMYGGAVGHLLGRGISNGMFENPGGGQTSPGSYGSYYNGFHPNNAGGPLMP